MTSGEATKNYVGSMTSTRWFVAGGLLSVVSALALAWSGTACVDVLMILLARSFAEVTTPGQQLARVCWCPLGLAVGTALIASGFRRTALRGRLSQRCLLLVGLYGVLAACGAFFLFQGTSSARGGMSVIAASDQAIKPEEVLAMISQSATAASAGWVLLVVAQILLSVGGFVLHADQAKSLGEPRAWPKSGHMALSLLWVFGALTTITWSRRSWEILQLRLDEPIKAAQIVEMLDSVTSMSLFASLLLLGHAILTTVVVVATYRTLGRTVASDLLDH